MDSFPTKEELKANRDYLIDRYKQQGLPLDVLKEAIEETELYYLQRMKACGYRHV